MSIICLEGASAVGKSSTSMWRQERLNAYIIQEVNKLFEQAEGTASTWYLEKQVERTMIAKTKHNNHKITILDGDPFQPLWYNWCYDFEGWDSLKSIDEFYRAMIIEGQIQFPDRYFYLYTTEEESRKRKENDKSSKRNNFERHLHFIKPQRAYFKYMNQLEPSLVTFIHAESRSNNIEIIVKSLEEKKSKAISDLELYDRLVEWVRNNKAAEINNTLIEKRGGETSCQIKYSS